MAVQARILGGLGRAEPLRPEVSGELGGPLRPEFQLGPARRFTTLVATLTIMIPAETYLAPQGEKKEKLVIDLKDAETIFEKARLSI